MTKFEEHFQSLTGDSLVEFIQERLVEYNFFEGYPHIVVVIPVFNSTGRWAAGHSGLLVIIEGSADCDELSVLRHSFLGLFGGFAELEFAVRGLYKVSSKTGEKVTGQPDVVEYEFTKVVTEI